MIDIRNVTTYGVQEAIRGMRNSWNSHEKSDSDFHYNRVPLSIPDVGTIYVNDSSKPEIILGKNDLELMVKLSKAHPSHAKYRRMISVYCDITAPLYWWKEFDTYKVGTVSNSESTMHTIMKRESFEKEDFSLEHLRDSSITEMNSLINELNFWRETYQKETDPDKKKDIWWQIIQLLPSSFNQTRTVMMNYEVLANIYENRHDHKLDEWRQFCTWIEKGLPYSRLITGKETDYSDAI